MAASSVILGGPPLLAGFLEKKGSGDGRFGRRNWKRRWFVLTRDKLEYFESTMAGEPLGSLVLREQVLHLFEGRVEAWSTGGDAAGQFFGKTKCTTSAERFRL